MNIRKLSSERLQIVTFAIPVSLIAEIDHVVAKIDVACPNRSAWLRGAVLRALRSDARKVEPHK